MLATSTDYPHQTLMTTRVEISLPTPNHKRVVVRHQYKTAEGAWVDATPIDPMDHGDTVNTYVHGSQRLIIEEVD